jgi:hypothetical protein
MTEHQKDRLKASLLASVGGGGLGYAATASDVSPIMRAIARRQDANLLPVYAGMAAGGRKGTGELMMSSNMVDMLRRAGFNAKLYDPEQTNILNHEVREGDALRDMIPNEEARQAELALYGLSNDPAVKNVSINELKGRSVDELMALKKDKSSLHSMLLEKVPGGRKGMAKFRRMLNTGKFDGIPEGILRDHMRVSGQKILDGRIVLGDPNQLRRDLAKAKQFFTGEGHMFYTGLPVKDRFFSEEVNHLNGEWMVNDPYPFSARTPEGDILARMDVAGGPEELEKRRIEREQLIAEDAARAREGKPPIHEKEIKKLENHIRNPELEATRARLYAENGKPFVDVSRDGRGPRSLGGSIGFSANYDVRRSAPNGRLYEELIPFSAIDDSFVNRTGIGSGLRHRADRRFLEKFIGEKSNLGRDALRGKKVVFLTSGGSGVHIVDKLRMLADATKGRDDVHFVVQKGKGEYTRGIDELVAKLNEGRNSPLVTSFEAAPQKDFQKLIRGSDLYASYGGSSTLSEALSGRTPTLFMHESSMNRPNLEWAADRFGVDTVDADAYFVRRHGEKVRSKINAERASKGLKEITSKEFWENPGSFFDPGIKSKPGEKAKSWIEHHIPGGRNPAAAIIDKAKGLDEKSFMESFSKKLNGMLDNSANIRAGNAAKAKQFIRMQAARNKQVVDVAKFLQGGLKIPGKYKALGAAVGALGAGGAAYGLSSMKKKPAAPIPLSGSSIPGIALAGGAGLAGLGGLAYYLNRRRKKKKEREMRKYSNDRSRTLKGIVKMAVANMELEKRASAGGTAAKGLGNIFKAFGTGLKGVGQLGAAGVEGVMKGTGKGARGIRRYGSLLFGTKGSKLDRAYDRLVLQRAPDADILAARIAKNNEWRKVITTRILSALGLGGGIAAIANSEGLE